MTRHCVPLYSENILQHVVKNNLRRINVCVIVMLYVKCILYCNIEQYLVFIITNLGYILSLLFVYGVTVTQMCYFKYFEQIVKCICFYIVCFFFYLMFSDVIIFVIFVYNYNNFFSKTKDFRFQDKLQIN